MSKQNKGMINGISTSLFIYDRGKAPFEDFGVASAFTAQRLFVLGHCYHMTALIVLFKIAR